MQTRARPKRKGKQKASCASLLDCHYHLIDPSWFGVISWRNQIDEQPTSRRTVFPLLQFFFEHFFFFFGGNFHVEYSSTKAISRISTIPWSNILISLLLLLSLNAFPLMHTQIQASIYFNNKFIQMAKTISHGNRIHTVSSFYAIGLQKFLRIRFKLSMTKKKLGMSPVVCRPVVVVSHEVAQELYLGA